ncbi:hypothetical protein LUZ61_008144 [Rhynchospora tenuis]|uniref:protein-serine/threonine phosphatase n=1 Tax=Rhynchospora tenuis TaxID=198213 RepID=A0AAD6EX80_9POAL|nr:hypothetical protein LUZ61_008144 [Rhynchospora tenuis]
MEDAVKVALAFTRTACGRLFDFYAVYEGHGDSEVALACSERMHLMVAEDVVRQWSISGSEYSVCWEDAMVESFRRLDAEVAANKHKERFMHDGVEPDFKGTVGSTALAAVVGEKRIIVANCGVSRAVLYRGGSAVALSSDHKPNRPDEMKRIEEAGGKVIESHGHRVWGILATSRSIGDDKLKPWVICEPEVTIIERAEEDEFLILASDGLWDVISNETACGIVRYCLLTGWTPAEAASLLTTIAISQDSRDNISVIVLKDILQEIASSSTNLTSALLFVAASSTNTASIHTPYFSFVSSISANTALNSCTQRVWLGVQCSGGHPSPNLGGFHVAPAEDAYFDMPLGWSGRIWTLQAVTLMQMAKVVHLDRGLRRPRHCTCCYNGGNDAWDPNIASKPTKT